MRGERNIFYLPCPRRGQKINETKNKIQTSSAVRTSGRCIPKKGLIANNERMLFAVTELRLPELKTKAFCAASAKRIIYPGCKFS